MSKLVIVGCSASSGVGFDPVNLGNNCPECPDLWINLVHQQNPNLRDLNLVNIANGGSSNTDIFTKAIGAITNIIDDDTSELWCQWTSLHRWQFDVGFETYPTTTNIVSFPHAITTNQFSLSEKYFTKLFNELRAIIHPHKEICKILTYVNIINNLCAQRKIRVRHINGLCGWDNNYFERVSGTNVTPSDYTDYTKNKILFVNNRDDDEILLLYKKLHNDYDLLGGPQEHTWINIYNPLYSNKLDVNFDNRHPGVKSNYLFYEIINTSILKNS
jgi:hypothetical protein